MRAATPGFNGYRLKEAREARGLTATALADLLGLTKAAVSRYEKGSATPRPDVLSRICDVLRLPPHFFTEGGTVPAVPLTYYRSLSTATKGVRLRAERRFGWLWHRIVPYLEEFVDFPPVNFPTVQSRGDPLSLYEQEIEDIASEVRRAWGLGDRPVGNLVWLLENNGVLISRGELGVETLDSFSAWIGDRPYIYVNADKSSAVRERYDNAHELGHLVMHRHIPEATFRNPALHRSFEDQAHRFAGAFLLPHNSFLSDVYLPTLNTFRLLKPKWLASIGVMIHRAADLGLASYEQVTNLWRAYGRQGWRRREPLDDGLSIEEPKLLPEAFNLILGRNLQSREDVLLSIPLAPSDIEELSQLPIGFLTNSHRSAPVRLSPKAARAEVSGSAEILEFRA